MTLHTDKDAGKSRRPFLPGEADAFGDGDYGLPQPMTAITGFAMTGFLHGVRYKIGGGLWSARPTYYFVGQSPCALPCRCGG